MQDIHPLAWIAWGIGGALFLLSFITLEKVRRALHLAVWPLSQIGGWFEGVKAFEVRVGQISWIDATRLSIEAEIRCNLGMGNVQEMALQPRGEYRIATKELMGETGETFYLPMMVAGTVRHKYIFRIPQTLVGKTHVMRLEAKLGKNVSKSSSFFLSMGDYRKAL